jgi:hypothetical protein
MEFDFFLAEKLGMSVARMRDEVGAGEYMCWSIYHARKAQRAELAMKQAQHG